MDVAEQSQLLCLLALRAGRREVCPGEECPLWEEGGCALERLSADGELYVDEWPDELPAALDAKAERDGRHATGRSPTV